MILKDGLKFTETHMLKWKEFLKLYLAMEAWFHGVCARLTFRRFTGEHAKCKVAFSKSISRKVGRWSAVC